MPISCVIWHITSDQIIYQIKSDHIISYHLSEQLLHHNSLNWKKKHFGMPPPIQFRYNPISDGIPKKYSYEKPVFFSPGRSPPGEGRCLRSPVAAMHLFWMGFSGMFAGTVWEHTLEGWWSQNQVQNNQHVSRVTTKNPQSWKPVEQMPACVDVSKHPAGMRSRLHRLVSSRVCWSYLHYTQVS